MTIATLLMIVAIILFLLAAFGVSTRDNLIALGLASYTMSVLLGAGGLIH